MANPAETTRGMAQAAECSLLGAILIDPESMSVAKEKITQQDFFNEVNKLIFKTACELYDSGKPIDLATVGTPLVSNALFQNVGGFAYLSKLQASLPSSLNTPHYCELIKNDSIRRKISDFASSLKALSEKPIDDIEGTLNRLGDELLNLGAKNDSGAIIDFGRAVTQACAELAQKSGVSAVKSGFIDLDDMIDGFRSGTLTILAARPAMGKTALGLNFMANAAIDANVPTAFFSLEMTTTELVFRVLSSRSSVDGSSIKKMKLSGDEWGLILGAAEKYHNAPIYIDETSGIEISLLKERAKKLHRQHGIKLIIVDYLQLIRSSNRRVQNREQEVADISRTLKEIAKDLKIPVIALAQLNRAVDARPDKRPFLSDLRESGSVEQDADCVMFIHRDDYYNRDGEQNNVAELIIAKNRSGPTGTVKLHWEGKYTRFDNLAKDF